MKILLLLLKASWQSVTIAAIMGSLSGVCSALLIRMVNETVAGNPVSLWEFVGVTIASLVATITSQYLLIRLAQGAIYELRLRLTRAILTTPLATLEQLGAGKLLATLTEDVQTIANTIFIIPFICIDLAVIASCWVYLAIQSLPVFLAMLFCVGFAIVTVQSLMGNARQYLKQARDEDDTLLKHFGSLTAGTKELKLSRLRRRSFFEDDLEPSAGRSRHYQVRALTLFSVATGWGNLLLFFIIGMILFALPKFIVVTPAILSAYALTMIFLMMPFGNLFQRLPFILRANVALTKVDEMGLQLEAQAERSPLSPLGKGGTGIGTDKETQNSPTPLSPPFQGGFRGIESQAKTIALSNVIHQYRGDREDTPFTLTIPYLEIPAGQLLFIVGGNGSGKSTLAKILMGLYPPETGRLAWDNQTIAEENLSDYRENFSAIFADFYLFDRVLETEQTKKQAQIYLEKLQIAHKVQIQDGMLSTTALSTGQRKRLALLNAYLEDRSVYVFDEWASDQDPVFRDLFYHTILQELKQRGKTVIVISHDDRYFNVGDRLIKLDYGTIESDRLT
jgi:putative pyoverdin transport system ATP-binding/permease protein